MEAYIAGIGGKPEIRKMKLFNKIFVFPIMIHKTSMWFSSEPNISIRWHKSKMGGTMKSTSYMLEIATPTKRFQFSFVWRPDVTKHWWESTQNKEE